MVRVVRTNSHALLFSLVVCFRCERLEEQLNDLTELHQNEILNLKQELASMEEKIAYQSYERARDIQVSLRFYLDFYIFIYTSFQTQISLFRIKNLETCKPPSATKATNATCLPV